MIDLAEANGGAKFASRSWFLQELIDLAEANGGAKIASWSWLLHRAIDSAEANGGAKFASRGWLRQGNRSDTISGLVKESRPESSGPLGPCMTWNSALSMDVSSVGRRASGVVRPVSLRAGPAHVQGRSP